MFPSYFILCNARSWKSKIEIISELKYSAILSIISNYCDSLQNPRSNGRDINRCTTIRFCTKRFRYGGGRGVTRSNFRPLSNLQMAFAEKLGLTSWTTSGGEAQTRCERPDYFRNQTTTRTPTNSLYIFANFLLIRIYNQIKFASEYRHFYYRIICINKCHGNVLTFILLQVSCYQSWLR